MPPWLRTLVVLAVAVLALLLLAWLFQRRLLYFPDRTPLTLTPEFQRRGLEDVTLTTADGVLLRASYWPGSSELTVVLFHGNAGNRAHRLDWMAGLHARGWSVFLLDYRGYGGSAGNPTEEGLLHDAEAAVAWLEGRGRRRLAYLGESLGCGVSVRLASRRAPEGLVLQAGAVSLVPVARGAYPFLPVGLLMRDRFDVADEASRVVAPALCLHGDLDEIIPVEVGRALFDALGGPKTWWEVEGAGHNDLLHVAGSEWYERVDAFLRGLEGSSRKPR